MRPAQLPARRPRSRPLAGLFVALVVSATGHAQALRDVRTNAPLTLKARGSFYVGGERVVQSPVELGSFGDPGGGAAGTVTIHPMYVDFMVPAGRARAPVVMLHGVTLTGKSFDTTPDGRMGWYEYFVRRGHPVYLPDTIGRGRSGFNQAVYNSVRAGRQPPSALPEIRRLNDDVTWLDFRFGPRPGVPFPDSAFPLEAVTQLAAQSIPDLDATLPSYDLTSSAVADLAASLGGAILLGHSMGALYPTEAALRRPDAVRAIVLVESCSNEYDDRQIAVLAKIPLLAIWGDHVDNPTGVAGFEWTSQFEGCKALVARLRAAGGTATFVSLPERGLRGNSHMLMMDRNSLQIADLILDWLATAVPAPPRHPAAAH